MLTSFSTALAGSGFLVGSCTSVCVCVCGVHACFFVVEHFLLSGLQARRGSPVESNSVILGKDPANSDASVKFRGVCQGQYLLHLH